MKKLLFLAITLCLVAGVVLPAMAATEVTFSGYYRVRGLMNDNILLNDDATESQSYYDNRFRLQTVFKANDNVSVTTRFDALKDQVWGSTPPSQAQSTPVLWDRIYMEIKPDFGTFKIGHQDAGTWGLPVFDDDCNRDRIKFTGKTGPAIYGAAIQKHADSEVSWVSDGEADLDGDAYYLFGLYKTEMFEGGLLYGYLVDDTVTTQKKTQHAFLPYGKVVFGPAGVQGEIVYETGEVDVDDTGNGDYDINTLCYNLEGFVNVADKAKLYAGYASVSGQDYDADDEFTMGDAAYGGLGDDFNPFAILTYDLGHKMLNGFGASNALSALMADDPTLLTADGKVALMGVNLWYLGADVKVNDQLTLKAILGGATANESDWADDMDCDSNYGMEADLGVVYQIFPNLQYSATLAYLWTGDLAANLVGVDPDHAGNDFGVLHEIKASF